MKLGIAGRFGGTYDSEDAVAFAKAIQEEAKRDEWVRVLYAVSTPDNVEIEGLTFRLDPTG